MVGHLGVFVKVLYFVQAFISNVGLRNVLGTISQISVKPQKSGSLSIVAPSENIFSEKWLDSALRWGPPQCAIEPEL